MASTPEEPIGLPAAQLVLGTPVTKLQEGGALPTPALQSARSSGVQAVRASRWSRHAWSVPHPVEVCAVPLSVVGGASVQVVRGLTGRPVVVLTQTAL